MGISRTKKQRRKAFKVMLKRVAAVLLIGVFILVSLQVYEFLTTSEKFAIATVEFQGMSRVDADEVAKLLEDLKGQNLLLAPLDDYKARLLMHPRVAAVTMRRVLPDKVTCTVEEREPVALLFTDRFLEVDQRGMVMEEDEYTAMLDLPIITGVEKKAVVAGKVSSDDELQHALEALRLCKNIGGAFADDISELRVSPSGVTIRSLSENCVLVLGNADYENRLRKYFMLRGTLAERERSARLIDLRFEDQVVLRGQI